MVARQRFHRGIGTFLEGAASQYPAVAVLAEVDHEGHIAALRRDLDLGSGHSSDEDKPHAPEQKLAPATRQG